MYQNFKNSKSKSKTICYTVGRPPWYNSHGQMKEAFLIGLCGGSASGKTTVAKDIIDVLGVPWVVIISLDSFYKVLSHEEHLLAEKSEYNFDHADAFDWKLACETLKKLKEGKSVQIPIYDFATHSRLDKQKTVYGASVVIFEGIMTFVCEELLELLDMKIFVDTDSDIRLARRLKRDISERCRDIHGVLKQYDKFVKPMFEKFIAPTMKCADIVVPWEGENKVAINVIVKSIKKQLEKRGFNFRADLITEHEGKPLPENLHIVEDTPQVRGLQAIIRNRDATRDDFIFYSKRLMRILMEKTMSLLPFEPYTCETPQGSSYNGMKLKGCLCGVSILRAGEALEEALVSVKRDAIIGKMLIQTNINTTEPELHYIRLPKHIENHQVILMDATVATGAAALMAIRILLDHDVKEENIYFVSLIMARTGVYTIASVFPNVKIVTASVDPTTNEEYHIIPGIGNFGNRYFGTDDDY
ncbi:uridine-cytidine kinase-like 1 isoform X2 [Hydra vulgaris]|uniref:Uridine kinase n=1 Tax=Hydra vulgaris TaxID=6087 RepID=A0ABM4D320_HYDVU